MCKQKWFYLCEQTLEWHMFELVISSMCLLILGGWYGTGDGWKVSQPNESKSQSSSFHLTSSPLMWRPLHPRQDKDLSCLLNPLMSDVQKCSTQQNYFHFKTDLD